MKLVGQLKHWQIFIFIGLPFLLMFFMPFLMFKTSMDFGLIMILMLVWMVSLLLYILLLGILLNSLAKFSKKPNVYLFTLLLLFSLFYSVFFVTQFMNFGAVDGNHSAVINGLFEYLVPMHLLAMFANFYGIRYNAKLLVSIEKGSIVTAKDYLGEFFMFWFIPIGIWAIQPRVNQLCEDIKASSK